MKNFERFRNKRVSAAELHALLEKAGMSFKPPVDIEALIKKLDITIDSKPDFRKIKVLGSITIKNSEPVIWINRMANQLETRKRFTLAHELGHFMLHLAPLEAWSNTTGFNDETIGFNRDDEWDYQEMEANRFAAQILMPIDYVKVEYEKLKGKSTLVEEMADYFNVSKLAMKYRLESLELKI
ncbi:MAG: ImmA/IrrE family metallo-endopeptidase [Campylobacterales bacterium]|nr:ImmA/IrrE family metallo-endopeptidase [Campylobacterales bacterium]MBD3823310.1 ImmA/IrrE family metallo-endopeptidase [Campylobacterota bacterium]MBD3841583.1 ImmA/IrrE family metallo-endopeptidase [Campylobacterales bacterium]